MSASLWTRAQGFRQRASARWLGRRMCEIRPRSPIISFTFDDFPQSALSVGGRVLKENGAVGTYYVSLGLMGQDSPSGRIFSEADLKEAVASGHELGCHTFAHCHSWDTAPRLFEESIEENQRAMTRMLPGTNLESLSYPIGSPRPDTKRRAGRRFECCRFGGQTYNLGLTDMNLLKAFFLEQARENMEPVRRVIDENRNASGWLIFATHDVTEFPSRFGCTPGFFKAAVEYAKSSGARLLPVAGAWQSVSHPA